MVVIDCINITSNEPGDLFKIKLDDLRKRRSVDYSLHQLEFVDSINLISLLSKVPETIIFGIKPFDVEGLSLNISESLRERFEDIYKKIEEEILIFFN